VCVDSRCACAGDLTSCGGSCVDPNASDAHCGACNRACGAGEACADGDCVGGVLALTVLAANTTVGLEWPRVPGAIEYRVYHSTSPGVTSSDASFTDSEPATVHRGLTNGTTLYYRVSATTTAGVGPLSNEVSATPSGEWALEALGAGDFDDVVTGNRVPRLPIEDRVHVLLLPEGYLDSELTTFHSVASHDGGRQSDVDRWMDEIFAIEPYSDLREAFVVWYLPRASQAHVGAGATAFGVSIASGAVSSANGVATPLWSTLDGQGPDAFPFPPGAPVENHVAAFLILDPQNNRAGFSGITTSLTNPSNNQQRIRTAFARGHAHEFTHAFANLRDEYLEDNTTITQASETQNVAPDNQCSALPWAHLLEGAGINESPGLVGAFGRPGRGYRSELKCQMNGTHENGNYYCGSEVNLNLRSDGRLCNFCREMTAYRVFDHAGILRGNSGFETWKSTYRAPFFERFGFRVPSPVPQTLTCPGGSTSAPDEPCIP
jgi:hypothetical protein